MRHHEGHRTAHIGRLRTAVLGANDGFISTASLMVGVAAVAGLVAGAVSMAAGEYVSRPRPAGGRPAHGPRRAQRACPR
jgi:VIT1/CCC1 family predicted Fe2+/Mn2+ transporter